MFRYFFSSTPPITTKYKESKLNLHSSPETTFEFIGGDLKKSLSHKEDGTILRSNHSCSNSTLENSKYFIMDENEHVQMKTFLANFYCETLREETLNERLSSLTNFMDHSAKNVYIRAIAPAKYDNKVMFRVFTDDVLEIIPILMKLQKTPLDPNDIRITTYKTKWIRENNDIYSTIDILELSKILEEFDINKELVTIVDDDVQKYTARQMVDIGLLPITVFSPDGRTVMDISQAVFHILSSAAFKNVWPLRLTLNAEKYKENIVDAIKEYTNMPMGTYIAKKKVDEKVKFTVGCLPDGRNGFSIKINAEKDEKIPLKHIKQQMDKCELPHSFNAFLATINADTLRIPVWLGRYLIMKAGADKFFGKHDINIKIIVMDALLLKIPEEKRQYFVKKHCNDIESDLFRKVSRNKIETYNDAADLLKLLDLIDSPKKSSLKKPSSSSISTHFDSVGLADTHCYFCYSLRLPEDETMRCEGCLKVVHKKCGMKWLGMSKVCGHCRQEADTVGFTRQQGSSSSS
ncbi:hypothetical protein GCK72_010903 [Caenorhabditis remanei]|uniref:Uncharacterized protein n=1 Tax=Caenorhabditis remanei TaxID=31234 RepID=A0A6A5H6X5_CAERE|nr:hypothetical protein GCK72_010903 [Caenorhabditis remanei]KAF1762641.1 hypothetical protein GCK72_010903 [Caenorhabditis remanei]